MPPSIRLTVFRQASTATLVPSSGGEAVRVSGAECSSLILMKRGEPAHGARAGSLSYLLSSLGSADDVLEHYAARGSRYISYSIDRPIA